jgi:hypothetical protein
MQIGLPHNLDEIVRNEQTQHPRAPFRGLPAGRENAGMMPADGVVKVPQHV